MVFWLLSDGSNGPRSLQNASADRTGGALSGGAAFYAVDGGGNNGFVVMDGAVYPQLELCVIFPAQVGDDSVEQLDIFFRQSGNVNGGGVNAEQVVR